MSKHRRRRQGKHVGPPYQKVKLPSDWQPQTNLHPAIGAAEGLRLTAKLKSLYVEIREHINRTEAPAELLPALISAELGYRLQGALVAAVCVDYDRMAIPVPEDCDGTDMLPFMARCGSRDAKQCVSYAFVADANGCDKVVVLFMTTQCLWKASVIIQEDGRWDDWEFEFHDAKR